MRHRMTRVASARCFAGGCDGSRVARHSLGDLRVRRARYRLRVFGAVMTRDDHLAMVRHQLGHGVDFLAAALSALTVSYYSWPSIRWRFWVAQSDFCNAHAWLALADEERL